MYGEGLNRELGSDDTTALFTTARRKQAINDAQLEFAKQTECFTKSASVTMVDATREYDLEAIAADDFIAPAKDGFEYVYTDANGDSTFLAGDDFARIDYYTLGREQPGWHNVAKVTMPDGYYLREDGGKVYLGLTQPSDVTAPATAAVTVPYLAIPPDMTGDTNQPFSLSAGTDPKRSLRPWHQALVHYAAALLEPLRKNFPAEQRQRALFAGMVADYLQRHRPRNGTRITQARDYRGEARGTFYGPREDPRVWP
jgi:hypothetical protein